MVKDGEYGEKEVKDAAVTRDKLAVTYSLLHADCTYMSVSSDILLDFISSRLCPKLLLHNAWCESSSKKAWVTVGNSFPDFALATSDNVGVEQKDLVTYI